MSVYEVLEINVPDVRQLWYPNAAPEMRHKPKRSNTRQLKLLTTPLLVSDLHPCLVPKPPGNC